MATLKKKTQAEIERDQKKAQERFKKVVERTKKEREKEYNRGVQRKSLNQIGSNNIARVQIGKQMIEGEMTHVQVEFKDNEKIPLKMLNKEINISSGYSEVVINLIIRNPIGKDL